MMWLFFLLAGVVCGGLVHNYVVHFARKLSHEVYSAYIEIYPENPPHFMPGKSVLKPLQKQASALIYGMLFALFFLLCYATNEEPSKGLCLALYITILSAISLVDWHYRLISPTLCQALLALPSA